jgi:hypothetical protein
MLYYAKLAALINTTAGETSVLYQLLGMVRGSCKQAPLLEK